jgi:leader peptidase (prepilin peptidase)/N-methyltransferase
VLHGATNRLTGTISGERAVSTINTVLSASPVLLAVVAGTFGLTVGSFLNVVIYRLPVMLQRDWEQQCREMLAGAAAPEDSGSTEREPAEPDETFNLVTPRSRCGACGTPIKSYQNIPLISYLILRGRCAACGKSISIRYPMVELSSGILSAIVAWHFGYTFESAAALALVWSLIALSMIDLDHQLLPDIITLPLMWLGLGLSLFTHADGSALFVGPADSIIGAIAGYLSLWSIYQGFRLATGKEGMGYGDFKLLAALGAWLGWQMLFPIVILSAIVGLIAALGMIIFRGHDRQIPIPFGPYLAVAGFVALIWGPRLIAGYMSVSGL